jgi:hypothetical protein
MSEEAQPRKVFHKLPALYRKISDVDMERDIRVRLLGSVVEKEDNGFVLSDGISTAKIQLDKELLNGLKENDKIRVFARVLITESGPEFRAELIQDMGLVDMDLYSKVHFNS